MANRILVKLGVISTEEAAARPQREVDIRTVDR